MKTSVKILLLAVLPIVVFTVIYFYIAKATIGAKELEQPILFSHKVHAGDNQIPCQYCHSYVAESPRAGIPSVRKCMGCHAQISGQGHKEQFDGRTINFEEEINKLKEYWNEKEPIPWIRIYNLPDFTHFTHKRHILRGFECRTCHGEVAEMNVVERAHRLEMGWCISCHEANAKDERELAHLKDCLTCHY